MNEAGEQAASVGAMNNGPYTGIPSYSGRFMNLIYAATCTRAFHNTNANYVYSQRGGRIRVLPPRLVA